MNTINITPLRERYILDEWDKIMSFESFLDVLRQRAEFDKCAIGIETNKDKHENR